MSSSAVWAGDPREDEHACRCKTALQFGIHASGAALMHPPPNRKAASSSQQRDALRRARAAAPVLRDAWPHASMVRVELAFEENAPLGHAPQAFSIFPGARAHFVYACPFGNCDGSFDLNAIAFDALGAGQRRVRGALTCTGHRTRDGKSHSPCELPVTYSIAVRQGNEPRETVGAGR